MGRLIIKHSNGRLESLKCKSKERAKEIVSKRPSTVSWNFYEENQRIPDQRPKEQFIMPSSFEELDQMIKKGKL